MQVSLQNNTGALATRAGALGAQLAGVGLGFLCARAPLLGLRPLALVLCAACPAGYALATAAGAAFGYALQTTVGNFAAYLAAVLATVTLRTAKKQIVPWLPCALAGGVYTTVQCGMAIMLHSGVAVYAYALGCGTLSVGLGLLVRAFFATPRDVLRMGEEPLASAAQLTVTMALVVMLAPYRLWYLHPVHIVAGLLCLAAACRGKQGSGALYGIGVAVALVCADEKLLCAGLGIAAGSALAGFLAPRQQVRTALLYVAGSLAGLLAHPAAVDGVLLCTETLFTAALFLALPPAWLRSAPVGVQTSQNAAGIQLTQRLHTLSRALADVGKTVSNVCARLPRNTQMPDDVCNAVADSVCRRCKSSMLCWVNRYDETLDCLQRMLPILAQGAVTVQDLPPLLSSRCLQPQQLATGLNSQYAAFAARRDALRRNEIVRSALTEQYGVMASSLAHLAEGTDTAATPDARRSARVLHALQEAGYATLDASVMTLPSGVVRVTVRLRSRVPQEETFTQFVSNAARVELMPPEVTDAGGVAVYTFSQKYRYAPQFGVCSLAAGSGPCADATRFFTTPRGTACAVLCDGMGTGGEAAIDGTMAANFAAELLEAGFECLDAARLVNVALSLKGDEDTGAGTDLLQFDLYSGRAAVFKAGGAPSYFLRDGRVAKRTADGLPIGILGAVSGYGGSFTLQPDDTVVLVSDGAVAEDGEDWLAGTLQAAVNLPVQDMAQAAAHAARERVTHPDDITVLVIRLIAC